MTWSNSRFDVSTSFVTMATNLPSCFFIQFLEQLLKFLVNFTLLKYVKSQRSYGFFIVCDRSVSVNVITHTFVGLKCLTETKIQILCDQRFHTVEMECQMVQLLSAHIVRPTMCVSI